MKKRGHFGFTIVELLIVIVVIGILAAVTVVAFGTVQDRARASSASGDISKASRKAGLVKTLNGSVTTADLLSGTYALSVGKGSYSVFTVCANAAGEYAAVAETRNGDVYYSVTGGTIVKNNSLNSLNPCPTLGIASPATIYGGMPATNCAGETGSCIFTGTRTIAFGSLARGEFIAQKNQVSPVSCSNAYFTDPSPGFAKACYVLEY